MAPKRNIVTIPTTPPITKFSDLAIGDLFRYKGSFENNPVRTVYMKIMDDNIHLSARGVSLASGSAFIIPDTKELIRVHSVLVESKKGNAEEEGCLGEQI